MNGVSLLAVEDRIPENNGTEAQEPIEPME